ncbi:BTB/POZ and MATH domain-containing protein 3 isoform X1 [Quercus robur]|uniref:BTB/POZ and MATH domain-containing protein 3 isoform X1 n=1 Tax=Quercus robur TaxID=38942 RepID=UPI002163CDCA|nr:BTB/POZ and MATH domain-containing protein 3 isoform X1 [Quercus robur]
MNSKPPGIAESSEPMANPKPGADNGSSSSFISETVNGTHRFTVQGYSLAKGMGVGKYIMSDTFTVGGYDWAIYFYPDGKNPEDNSMYVSVFIALASDGTDVRALFELSMVDQSGNGNNKVHSHFQRALESGPYTLKYRGSMWGYKRFYRRNLLEASDYLKDDCLVMYCKVGVVRNHLECPKLRTISVPPSDMGQGFKDLLDSEVGCDIVFQVGNEMFKAHKLILAARSPVFRAQFFGLVGNPNIDKVVVKDIDPFIFKAMLLFIYTDKLPDVDEVESTVTMCSSTVMVQHLLAAADLYNLDRLKLLCESELCKAINIDTVATILALAEQHHCPQLKDICLKFTANPANLGAVMKSEAFGHLEESCPSLLSELLATFASMDENPNSPLSRKRSSSSVFGLDLAGDGAEAESVNPNGRRLRRRL